jgi:single-strand DNA-binding protein
MASYNRVLLIGNLGADPELRQTVSGHAVANFSLATNERWTNRAGDREERVQWHRVVAWGRLARFCADRLKKGCLIHVEGRLQTRQWDDKEGHSRMTTEVVAGAVEWLGSPAGRGDNGDEGAEEFDGGAGEEHVGETDDPRASM